MLREAAFSQGSGAIPCRRRCEGDRQSRAKEVEWEGGRVSEWSVLWVEVVVAAIHDETKTMSRTTGASTYAGRCGPSNGGGTVSDTLTLTH